MGMGKATVSREEDTSQPPGKNTKAVCIPTDRDEVESSGILDIQVA